MYLYYPTLEAAQQHYPNSKITEYINDEYLAYIKLILDNAVEHKLDYKGRNAYKIRIPCAVVWVILFEDKDDNTYLDGLKYQMIKDKRLVEPVGYELSNPKTFCKRFLLNNHFSIEIYSKRFYGQPALAKPKELKSVIKAFSVKFCGNKTTFQCFLKDGDLWFKCTDYFSEQWRPPGNDFGNPTTYYANKYFNFTKSKKFIYDDNWSSIVLRNEAWVKIIGFEKQFEIQGVRNLKDILFQQWATLHHINWTELDLEWERLFGKIVNEYDKYKRNENG